MGQQKKATPETYQVRLTTRAEKNFDEITGYIAFINQEPLNAVKVGDQITETIDRIGLNPYAFRECEELTTKSKIFRRAVCKSWQIIYRINSFEIVVLGILHTSRKASAIKALRKIK